MIFNRWPDVDDAAAAESTGLDTLDPLDPPNLQLISDQLRAEMLRLQLLAASGRHEVDELRHDLAGHDAVDDGFSRLETDHSDAVVRAAEQRLASAAAAIGRIDAGTFGVCDVCRGPIAGQRLLALPHIDTCIACARRRRPSAV